MRYAVGHSRHEAGHFDTIKGTLKPLIRHDGLRHGLGILTSVLLSTAAS
jgi:hypothetical protein